jgi:hypothetical protein
MRTYDPADGIRYVHLAQRPAAPRPAREECHPLPAGYANTSLRGRLGARPVLAVLPGGSATAGPTAPAPALRLVR